MSSHSTPHTTSVNHVNNTPTTSTSNGINSTNNNTQSPNPLNLPLARPIPGTPNGHSNGVVVNNTNGVPASTSATQPPMSWIERGSINRKRKWTNMGFNEPEQAVMERTTMGFHLALAQDQLSTLFPEQPSRFKSYEDVVEKLVPYHIWQVCDEELDGQEGGSEAKRKQREVRENEVTDVLSRMTKINQRFMALRTRTAATPSPTVDLISLIRESTSAIRDEVSIVQRDYRRLNAERDAIEMEAKRKADHAAYLRGVDAISKSNEERGKAAKEALRAKEAQAAAKAAAAAAKATPAPAPKPSARPTPSQPALTSASPAASPQPHHQTPTPTRGRGRPRGAGGGGLRAQVLTHGATPAGSPAPASPSPSLVRTATATASTKAPMPLNGSPAPPNPIPAKASSPAVSAPGSPAVIAPPGSSPGVSGLRELIKQGPVIVNFPTTSLPDLFKAGIVIREPDPTLKPPGYIVKQQEGQARILISLDVRKCKPPQLAALSSILQSGGFIRKEDQTELATQPASAGSGT